MSKNLLIGAIAVLSAGTAMAQVETRAHYATNPDLAVGVPATISIDGEFDDWDESMIVALSGANDQCNAFKGSHENCVLDCYALYAAWDDQNLYFAWQMCNTGDIWAREGDGPLTDYGRIGDVPLALCLSINPKAVSMTGLNAFGKGLWGDKANMGYGFDGETAHVDRWLLMSGKAGQGEPAIFASADADGNSNYNSPYCQKFSACGIQYKMKEGFQPSHLWRQMTTADYDYSGTLISDPSVALNIYDEECYFNILSPEYETYRKEHGLKPHDTKYDSFYEIKIPFTALGIDREYLETYGIGARMVATRGESAIDCIPFDPAMMDNVFGSYGADKSTSAEKDDFDNITYQPAWIGKIRGNVADYPDPKDPTPPTPPTPPVPGDGSYNVYLRNTDNWTNPMVWIWDAGNANKNYTGGSWPGAAMTKVTVNDEELYKYSFDTEDTLVNPMVIFSSGKQTDDLVYENNAIYDCSGQIVGHVNASAINTIQTPDNEQTMYFDLQGRRIDNPTPGIYIVKAGSRTSKVHVK